MTFIHAIVVDEANAPSDPKRPNISFDELAEADYTVHILMAGSVRRVIVFDDNIHSDVETQIDYFIQGAKYAMNPAETIILREGYIVVPQARQFYNVDLVMDSKFYQMREKIYRKDNS